MYIWKIQKKSINQILIEDGFAFEYTYKIPYKYQLEFKNAQNFARDHNIGLWGNVCMY